MSVPQTFEIKFLSIELVSKELKAPQVITAETEVELDLNFQFSVSLKLAPPIRGTVVVSEVFIQDKRNNNTTLASFRTYCFFEIVNFNEVFRLIDEKHYNVPVELEIILKSAGLSTTRGIIYSELRGTYLQNSILPLIDISAIIKKNRSSPQRIE